MTRRLLTSPLLGLFTLFMEYNQATQPLSHDEKRAAEAAFGGRPFNPKWSASARLIYDGLLRALPAPPVPDDMAAESVQRERSTPTEPAQQGSANSDTESDTDERPAKIPFKQAVESGALIDVTPTAKELGMSFPVTVTKPLWDVGIAPTKTLSQEEQLGRLRDVLMAFRLRLATQPSISPLIDFPALLAFPPSSVPQPIPLFALVQPDEHNRAMVTLLLPNEVAATIIPMN